MLPKLPHDPNHILIRIFGCEISAGGVWGVAAAVLVAVLLVGAQLYAP